MLACVVEYCKKVHPTPSPSSSIRSDGTGHLPPHSLNLLFQTSRGNLHLKPPAHALLPSLLQDFHLTPAAFLSLFPLAIHFLRLRHDLLQLPSHRRQLGLQCRVPHEPRVLPVLLQQDQVSVPVPQVRRRRVRPPQCGPVLVLIGVSGRLVRCLVAAHIDTVFHLGLGVAGFAFEFLLHQGGGSGGQVAYGFWERRKRGMGRLFVGRGQVGGDEVLGHLALGHAGFGVQVGKGVVGSGVGVRHL